MNGRGEPMTAAEIERHLRSPAVRVLRPVILGGIGGLALACRFRWEAEGVERLAAIDGRFILAANHASHADTAAILGTLPASIRRRTCVAAALDVFGSAPGHPGRRGPLRVLKRECLQITVAAGFYAFAFDRHGPPLRSLRTATHLVRSGWNLLLYPEGTRSRTGALGPFKAGVGVLARTNGCPVVPVHVAGGTSILPCGATIPRAGRAIVRYGHPLRPRPDEPSPDFTARIRHAVQALALEGRITTAAAAVPETRLSGVSRDAAPPSVS